MHVPNLTLAILGLNIFLALALPLGALLVLRRKTHSPVMPFLVGCLTFYLAVMVLESLVHRMVLNSPLGQTILGSAGLYALYGGLMAGLFEEIARFVAMKQLVKKYSAPATALMYGAGHGGIEAAMLMGVSMLQNLVYGLMINAGATDALLSGLTEEQAQTITAGLATLAATPSALFLLSPLERIIAMVLHISLSVLVWQAATQRGKLWMLPAAIGVHALVDAVAVLLQRLGMNVVVIEGLMILMDAAVVFWASRVYRQLHTDE